MTEIMPFSFDKIAQDTYFISNLVGFNEFVSSKELADLVRDPEGLTSTLLAALEAKQFLYNDGNLSTIQATSSGLSKKLSDELTFNPVFMIVPTLRCDHTCSYCQVSRAPMNDLNADLDIASIPRIVEVIKKLCGSSCKVEIQGGEPLVRFDIIQEIYSQLEISLNDISFEMVITTSLSLLDNTVIQWSKNKPISFSVSLDGGELIHDKNRIISTNNSYQLAIDGIRLIQNNLSKDRVATVTTVTREALTAPDNIIDAHISLELDSMFVRPISPYGLANTSSNSDYTMSEFMAFYEELVDSVVDRNLSGFPLIEQSALIHLRRLFQPGFSSYADLKSPSGVLLNCVLFNYDGKIYGSDEARMLQRVNKGVDLSLGLIEDNEWDVNRLYRTIIKNGFTLTHTGCSTCAYQPYCGHDPARSLSTTGDFVGDKSGSDFCEFHYSMFNLLLNKYHTSEKHRLIFEGWLNG
jgi:His-Xaa-Ser system radical SAM maturase HxsB